MPEYDIPIPWHDRIASTLIATPLQRPAEWLRWVAAQPHQRRHPELDEIYIESRRIRQVIDRAIADKKNCIDVGAHLGSVLCEFVRLSPNGRHIAVEPVPYKARWLKQKFPQVEVHQVALGEEDRRIEFFYNPRRSGFSSLRLPTGHDQRRSINVSCKRLDDIVPQNMSVDFVKLDVEGGEYHVLKGAEKLIAKSHPIILLECTGSGLSAFDITSTQIFSFFTEEIRYSLFLLKGWLSGGAPLDLAEFEASMVYPFQAFNYVAVPVSQGFG
jgi:FkbM family methyltransferase